MDLVDLFIGAEGTLGVIVDAELTTAPRPAAVIWLVIPLGSEADGISATDSFRRSALAVAAIEHLDQRSIEILRQDGVDRRLGFALPGEAGVLLLIQIEADDVQQHSLGDELLAQLATLLAPFGADDQAEVILPSDSRRAAAVIELREAVPAGVNRRVAAAHLLDQRIHKTAADMIVPFDRFAMMMSVCRALCADRHLDLAVWGHISDGNVHPNVIPKSYADVESGREMILELARHVIGMGGSPLAEHGVGRHPVKQQLLEMLYGRDGIDSMRKTKLALDPEWKLAPGVLFDR